MAQPIDRAEVFEVTVNALTTKEAARVEPTNFPPGEIEWVRIEIPDGVAGLAGVRIAATGRQIYPNNTGMWLVGNDEVIREDVYNWPNSGRFSVEAYNEDNFAHTFTITFGVRENEPLPSAPTAGAPPLALSPQGETQAPIETPTQSAPGEPGAPTSEPPTFQPPTGPGAEPPQPTPPPPVAPPPEGAAPPPPPEPGIPPPPPEGPTATEPPPPAEPPEPTFTTPTEPSTEGEEPSTEAGTTPAARAKPGARKAASKERTRVVVSHETRPAGGWLPAGARFSLKRTDQGQDFITNWRGRIIAPAAGHVVHVLRDKPYPSGFGPSYAVVHIDSGPFGGEDWYVGHCSSRVRVGQRFEQGATLAIADQGHVEGGGWVELGPAPGGYPGKMGGGARIAGLFRPLTVTHRRTVAERPPRRRPSEPRRRPSEAPRRRAPSHVPAGPRTGGTPYRRPAPGPSRTGGAAAPPPRRRPPAVRAPARASAPAPRVAPPPPPPPPPRRAEPAPRPRRRK